MNKFRTVGLLLNKKQQQTPRVLSKETLNNDGARLEASARTSVTRLSQRSGVSKSSVQAATKLLRLKPYKFTVVRNSRRQTVLRKYGCVTGSVKQCVVVTLNRW